jgi:hypothetical protein
MNSIKKPVDGFIAQELLQIELDVTGFRRAAPEWPD